MNTASGNPYVLIVEDHPLVSDSLVACVRACDTGLEIATAESLRDAFHILAQRAAPILIITDLTLKDARGTEAVKRLREACCGCPLLVVTAIDDPVLRSETMQLGASRYLIKSASTQVLRNEIRAAIGTQHSTNNDPAARRDVLRELLTPKQLVVLQELAAGRNNKEIASRLGIGDETVSSHIKEILGRLAVRNRTEAVIRYLQIVKAP